MKETLSVKTFGEFEISDGKYIVNDTVLRSDMLKKLALYLILHRNHSVTIQELTDALWKEDEVDNPSGALKNLMYRLRTVLKKTLGDEPYIVTSQGAYAWNVNINVRVDAEEFERLCKKAQTSVKKEDIIDNYENALKLYRGEFVENNAEQHWVVTMASYYHSMFLSAVKVLIELYMEKERYRDSEDLVVYALKLDPVDEELHCCYVRSLIRENKMDLALKQYDEAVKVLYDAFGIYHFAKLQKVQEELLKMSKGTEMESLENIHEDMDEDEEIAGVFFCGYPVFREIYRLEVRKSSRADETEEYVVLFTIELRAGSGTANEKMKRFIIDQAMSDFKQSLSKALRIGDVAARYSDNQFIVLLPSCSDKGGITVANRICAYFDSINKGKKVSIKTEYEQISQLRSSLVK